MHFKVCRCVLVQGGEEGREVGAVRQFRCGGLSLVRPAALAKQIRTMLINFTTAAASAAACHNLKLARAVSFLAVPFWHYHSC